MKTEAYKTNNQCIAQNYTSIQNQEVYGVKDSAAGFGLTNKKQTIMKIKLALLFIVFLSITTFAQDLTVTFENARNTNDGTDDFYEADIVVSSDVGFKLGDGQLYFDYNTAAFGTNVVANGNFEFVIPDGAILALPGGFGFFYSTNSVDNSDQVVSTNYSAQGSAGVINGNNITSTPTILFSIKIKYEDVSEDAGVAFNTEINGATEQFFTACGPFDTPANKDCTNFPGDQITTENATFDSTGAVISSDTTPPVITLTGNASETVEAGTTYTDDGATATDDTDGDITAELVIVNPVDTSVPGVYTVTYNVSDAAGNVATEVTREVTVEDTTVPVITLVGNALQTVEAGTTYADDGATASDSLDGDITAAIVTVNPVDTSVPGVYTVTYNVSDAAGNVATEVTREVTVADTTVPVITLIGNASETVEAGTTYTDDGATASDSLDGDITAAIVTVNPVDTSVPGVYTVTYNVSDAAGNVATEVTREVTVADTTVPVITLIGNASETVEAGTTYTDDGATATDDTDGDITSELVIVNPVDTSAPGVYTITYNVSDAAGNAATEVIREVTVVDTTVPEITLLGDNPLEIAQGDVYTDPGATAFDSLDGDITAAIAVVNPVDTSTEGTYTVTYNVMDAAGNVATEVTRTVNVSQVLSVEDNTIKGLKVYPNPVRDSFTITSADAEFDSIKLYNITGALVQEINPNKVNELIPMNHLQSGVYFLQMIAGDASKTLKLVKQ